MLLMALAGKALAEMLGTFAIIFVGGGSILLSERWPQFFPSAGIALTFGGIIALMILVLGNVSGAHFNPVVTLAFSVARRFPAAQVILYWFSQCAGGLLAAGLLLLLRKS